MLELTVAKPTDSILIVWGQDCKPEDLKENVESLQDKVAKLQLENVDRLLMGQ